MRRIANIVEFVFNPLLVASLLLTLIYFYFPFVIAPFKNVIILFIGLVTFLFPLISLELLKKLNIISDIFLTRKNDRLIALILLFLFYSVLLFLLIDNLRINECISIILFQIPFILFLLILFVLVKFSIHIFSFVWANGLGILLALSFQRQDDVLFQPVIIWILVSGVVLSSQLYLARTIYSIAYRSYVIGLIVSFLFSYYFRFIFSQFISLFL